MCGVTDMIKKYIDSYIKNYRNYKTYWNYEDGCILTGCIRLYEATADEKYSDFVLKYLSSVITDDGKITTYDSTRYSLDSFNSGKSLFFAADLTGNEKYLKAADFMISKLREYPRTSGGSFIHKSIYPDQVWLDGLYMAMPFYARYIKNSGSGSFDDIMLQFQNVRKYMFCPDKKLYRHGYDSAGIQPWADRKTGLSPSYWLRSIGWFLMALTDTAEAIGDTDNSCFRLLDSLFSEIREGLSSYADSNSGLFYQVPDIPSYEGNYTETSGSLMVSYALMKACHNGFSYDSSWKETSRKIFDSIIREKLDISGEVPSLTGICCSAGLGPGSKRDGSADYYLSEPVVSDDPKGTGALMMAFSEIIRDSRFSGGNVHEQ